MKRKSFKIVLVGIMALLLIVTSLGIPLSAQELSALDEIKIESVVTYGEGHKNATISFEDESEQYNVTKITGPNGDVIDITNPIYIVGENGTYHFDIEYQDLQENVNTVSKEVVVEEISTNKTEKGVVVPAPIGTYTSVVDGATKISIPDYDGIGWVNGAIKEVAVTVDFEDENSLNKKLIINVPEGMRYEVISIKDGTDIKDVDGSILSTYDVKDPLATGISSMKLPKREELPMGATSGALEFNFIPGIESATINFKISVDMSRYYGPHDIPNAITAQAFKGSTPQEIGNASQFIKATGAAVGDGHFYYSLAVSPTAEVLASTASTPSFGLTTSHTINFQNVQTRISSRFAKKAVLELYYPQGMEFVGLKNNNIPRPGYTVLESDTAEGRVVLEYDNWNTRGDFVIEYKVPEGMADGTYTTKAQSKMTHTWYDGTSTTRTNAAKASSVKVVSSFINAPTISGSHDLSMDSSIKGHTMFGPNFLVDSTSRAGTKTNQMAEFEIESDWQVFDIRIPFDNKIAGNKVTEIEYKTNLDSNWRTYKPKSDLTTTITSVLITKKDVGLKSDEFFTALRANVGSIGPNFKSSSYAGTEKNVGTVGSLKEGATLANVTFSIYEKDNKAATESKATGQVKATGADRKVSSNASASFSQKGTGVNTAKEGEQFNVKATLEVNAHEPLFDTVHALKDPNIYLRQPKGMTIVGDSIKIVDQDDETVSNIVTNIDERGDETFYTISTYGSELGSYFGENSKKKKFVVTYTVATTVGTVGDYNARDLIAWEKIGTESISNFRQSPIIDAYDFNGNGVKTENLLSVSDNVIKIAENKTVLVETYLTLAGEDPKSPYVESDPSTLAYFTPGTDADYTVKAINNDVADATVLETFIPIPKTGQSFGSNFQAEPFKWDMKLSGIVSVPPGFEASYSVDATEANYEGATYDLIPPANLAEVVMVKIKAIVPMPMNTSVDFKIPLKVDETFASATETPAKIGKKNVYNPVYRVNASNSRGLYPGTKVGTELSIAEIGGFVFIDTNKDGLYKEADGDTLVENHGVELYKLDELTNTYKQVLDASNAPITTKTNDKGVYIFDNATGMGYGTYAVRFVENPIPGKDYEYTGINLTNPAINSDAIVSKDIPNPGDDYKGWAIGIDPTKPEAKTIGCGFLQYFPPYDLKVTINPTPNTVKVGDTINVGSIILPDFWNLIQDPTAPYTWEIVGDATEKAKATLTNNNDGTVTITPAACDSTTTFELKLTIKDTYGNVKSDNVTITIKSGKAPTVVAPNLSVYEKDAGDLMSGVTASDNDGKPITLVTTGPTANTVITHTIPMTDGKYTTPGTYEVGYTVTDTAGNVMSEPYKRVVKVSGLPKIVSNGQVYLLSDDHILDDVKAAATASYLKASDTVGGATTETPLTGRITTTVVSGPNGKTDFTEVGIYKVKYDVTNEDNKVATMTVDVLVVPEGTVWDTTGTVAIYAQDFELENKDAKDLTKDTAASKALGNAYAFQANVDSDGIKTFADITSKATVYANELDAINKTTTTGGIYDLTFQVEGNGKTVTKLIEVVVKGTYTPPVTDELAITANDFTLTVSEARVLAEAEAIQKAGVKAHVMSVPQPMASRAADDSIVLSVNGTQLNAIRTVGDNGGTYKLEFTASYTDLLNVTKTTKVEVNVTVTAGKPSVEPKEKPSVNTSTGVETSDQTNLAFYGYIMLIAGGYLLLKKRVSK